MSLLLGIVLPVVAFGYIGYRADFWTAGSTFAVVTFLLGLMHGFDTDAWELLGIAVAAYMTGKWWAHRRAQLRLSSARRLIQEDTER